MNREGNGSPRPSSIHGTMSLEPITTPSAKGLVRRKRGLLRRLPTTREGVWFLTATLVVGAAAVNAGLNLLFLVFGMMLFLILASGVMSELTLRRLAVARRLPAAIHVGSPFLMGISVKNNKRRVPTFSLEVEDLTDDRPVDRRCYFLKIPAGREQETAYRNQLSRRGRHKLTGFRISTRFPFGLIRKARELAAPAEVIAYPALIPIASLLLPSGTSLVADRQTSKPSRTGEFHGLREFRAGDDPRQIHWKATARRGRLLLREHEDDASGSVIVRLETVAGLLDETAAFEQAISTAASVALWFLKQGHEVGLSAGQVYVPPRAAPAQSHAILRALALLELDQARGPAAAPTAAALFATVTMALPKANVSVQAGKRGAAA